MIDANSALLTPPMAFASASLPQYGGGFDIDPGLAGYGNAHMSIAPSTTGVDLSVVSQELVGVAPSGDAVIPVSYANQGASVAQNVVITATFDPDLIYVGDTSGFAPSAQKVEMGQLQPQNQLAGSERVWHLPGQAQFLGGGQFNISVRTTSTQIGTRLPITFTIAYSGGDAVALNDSFVAYVMVSNRVFLPVIAR